MHTAIGVLCTWRFAAYFSDAPVLIFLFSFFRALGLYSPGPWASVIPRSQTCTPPYTSSALQFATLLSPTSQS